MEVNGKDGAVACVEGLYLDWRRCGQERGSDGKQEFRTLLDTRPLEECWHN